MNHFSAVDGACEGTGEGAGEGDGPGRGELFVEQGRHGASENDPLGLPSLLQAAPRPQPPPDPL